MRTLFVSLFCAITLVSISACGFVGFPGVYRINVEQGNIIDQEKVDKLKIGMSRRQVRFILGTPMLEDSFNNERWDYTHTIRNGKDSILDENLVVYFEGEKLSRIEGDFAPTPDEPEPANKPAPTVQPDNSEADATSDA
ncbi:MAG: outer membrane protein assembly factor BamE [Halioglobus sp.]|jgi:outer membrane protein assembly factor BamE